MDLDEDPFPRKCVHTMVLFDEDEPTGNDHMALSLKITGGADHGSKTHAKAGDYDRATWSVIEMAIEIYCAMLLGNDPYPVPVKEIELVRAVWDEACHHHHVNTPHDPALLKLVRFLLSKSYNGLVVA